MKYFLSFIYTILPITLILSQANLNGKIVDSNGQPIAYANVLLLSAKDSSLLKGDLTNEQGNYTFEISAHEQYLLSSSFIGYVEQYSDLFQSNEDLTLPNIILSEGVELDEVQVRAKKPLFQQKIDRLVINVANSITAAGGNALEVLERSPGVIINKSSNALSMLGKEGVVIMINGKVSYQPPSSILQMLEGMAADNIEQIELITTPPSSFDAEGNAGFINIVLKSNPDMGLKGNLSLMAGYGDGPTGSTNLNVNYRRYKLSVFGSYSYFHRAQDQLFFNSRSVLFDNVKTNSEVITNRDPLQRNHNIRLGADYEIGKKTTIGVLFNTYDNKWTMDANNIGSTTQNDVLESRINLLNNERNQWTHQLYNFNIDQKIGSQNKLSFNIDFLEYRDENPNTYNTTYFDDQSIPRTELTRSEKITPILIKVAQLDYQSTINEKLKWDAGLKLVSSTFTNDVSVENQINNEWEMVDQFTNVSNLSEKIYAAYSSIDFKPDAKNTLKFGLRYEFTDSDLNTQKEGQVVDREFGTLFPSVFYSRMINQKQSLNLSYSKRITRPTYNDMAPFAIFLDPNTFFFGNASLQPAISNSFKIDYKLKSYMLSLQYTMEDSTISRFQDRVNIERNQQAFEPVNLSNTKLLSASLIVPVSIGKFWETQNSIILTNMRSNSFYEDELIEIQNTNVNINSSHTFLLPSNFSAEINAFYSSPRFMGRSTLEAIYGVNVGIQKKFNNGNALRFNVRDLFDSVEWRGGTNLPSQGFTTYGIFDFSNRTFSVSYSTSFGNKKLKDSRKRKTASEDERGRVN